MVAASEYAAVIRSWSWNEVPRSGDDTASVLEGGDVMIVEPGATLTGAEERTQQWPPSSWRAVAIDKVRSGQEPILAAMSISTACARSSAESASGVASTRSARAVG